VLRAGALPRRSRFARGHARARRLCPQSPDRLSRSAFVFADSSDAHAKEALLCSTLTRPPAAFVRGSRLAPHACLRQVALPPRFCPPEADGFCPHAPDGRGTTSSMWCVSRPRNHTVAFRVKTGSALKTAQLPCVMVRAFVAIRGKGRLKLFLNDRGSQGWIQPVEIFRCALGHFKPPNRLPAGVRKTTQTCHFAGSGERKMSVRQNCELLVNF